MGRPRDAGFHSRFWTARSRSEGVVRKEEKNSSTCPQSPRGPWQRQDQKCRTQQGQTCHAHAGGNLSAVLPGTAAQAHTDLPSFFFFFLTASHGHQAPLPFAVCSAQRTRTVPFRTVFSHGPGTAPALPGRQESMETPAVFFPRNPEAREHERDGGPVSS